MIEMLQKRFEIAYMSDALCFIAEQPKKVQDKIMDNVRKSAYIQDKELFKKLTDDGIWEFRTKYLGKAYRLLAFWDNDGATLVVATHGFIKKKQKTPPKEIAKAQALRNLYFENKNI